MSTATPALEPELLNSNRDPGDETDAGAEESAAELAELYLAESLA